MKYRGNKLARIVAILAVPILASITWFAWLHPRNGEPLTGKIGGPFALVDHHGRAVTDHDYLGKPTLVFFGFTFCPDVCPTTLFDLSNRLKELGPDADRLNILFITVDPARDTSDKLSLYLSSFDPRITGLSGSDENIRATLKAYRAQAHKVTTSDGDYTMDHTTLTYMMNSKGKFVGVINYQESEVTARAKIRRLLDGDRG